LTAEMPERFLGTSIHLAALSHPIHSAEQAAMLDVMTGGRFILGVGQGYRKLEFTSLGLKKAESADRLRESVAAMKSLFNGDNTSFEGDHYRFEAATMRPQPVTTAGPPIWVGSDNADTISRIPYFADAWIASGRQTRNFIRQAVPKYRQVFDSLQKPYPGVPMFRELHVAETRQLAKQHVGESFGRLMQRYHCLGQPGENYNLSTEEAATDRLIVGTSADAVRAINSYKEEFRVPFIWFRVYWPGMAIEAALETIRIVGEEVLPYVR
jgi:alkanesulfonate monooxygenase SsuD/methylene tetrahydromethanopterin reductase-like flavin-dependent oxidoreductase (luciferase family)